MENVNRRHMLATAAGAVALSVLARPAEAAENQQRAGAGEGSEFIVKFSGIKLPAEEEARIASALQATAVHELARTDLHKADLAGGLRFQIPIKWRGIWVDKALGAELPVLKTQRE
jgi:hypothetical protein